MGLTALMHAARGGHLPGTQPINHFNGSMEADTGYVKENT